MRDRPMRGALLVGVLLALGCGEPLPQATTANLEVEVDDLTAVVRGNLLHAVQLTDRTGLREADTGQFFLSGPDGSTMVVSVCPIGQLNDVDPYGGGGSPREGFPVDAGVDPAFGEEPALRGGSEFAGHCGEPSVSVCTAGVCTELGNGMVRARVAEQPGWRTIVVEGGSDDSTVDLTLRYRELR